ncbi:MAG: GAF domain-containing protein [Nitrospirae bacterium]|nr:GAF domain-containing protein [Nitrospirota bacterium]
MDDKMDLTPGGNGRDLKKALETQSDELIQARLHAGNLKAQVDSLRHKLETIKDLPYGMEAHYDLKSLLDHYLEVILRITETDAGSILLVREDEDDGTGRLDFFCASGPGSDKLKGWHIAYGEGIAGRVASMGTAYFSDDAVNDPNWAPEISRTIGFDTKDIMCVPMKHGGRVLGVIEVLNKRGCPFTRDDLDLLAFIAGHAAVMVENARLLAGYEEKVRHYGTLMDLANLLNSTLRREEVRTRAIEAATKLMEAEVGSLLLVDAQTDELYFEVALGDEGTRKMMKEIRLKIGQGIAGWVAQEAKPVIINDVQNDPRFFKGADKKTSFVTKNMVCVPVMTKGKVVGVLQAINKLDDRKFTESDRQSFESLANQVAIAIENAKLYDQLRQTFLDTAQALAEAIEKRDPYTGGHTKRVLKYSTIIAKHMGLPTQEIELLELAAVLHDVGKIGISDLVLGKQGPLNDEEYATMKTHAQSGADIISHVPALNNIIPGIRHHHERYDGKGYPLGIKGTDIPLYANIIAVADSFDAMTTTRPYRAGLSVEYAVSELKRCSGSQFYTDAVEAFIEAVDSGEVNVGE